MPARETKLQRPVQKTRWRAWKTSKQFSTFAPATAAGCSHKASWLKAKAVSMGGGTSGSTATEQRVMFQSLGPHNPTLASDPAVLAHREGNLALDNAFVLIDGAPG